MLVARGQAIQFDGFMKIYLEGSDEDKEESGMLPRMEQGRCPRPQGNEGHRALHQSHSKVQ